MSRLKELLGFGRVGGIDDLVGRAFKTAVQAYIGAIGIGLTPLLNVPAQKAALFAAAAAAVSVVMNAALAWAQTSE